MALGITFIYSIMKMINWAMGEFYMIGSYVQYALLGTLLPPQRWDLALPVALVAAIVLLTLFSLMVKQTWLGRAFRGAAQNRVGIQTAGIDVLRLDMLAFGVGVALAAAAGALLAPDFLVYPENGSISTFKGFEIIVIGGLGSIPGSVVGGVLLGVIEALGSVFIASAYKDLYGFVLLIALPVLPPTGPFGERERTVWTARPSIPPRPPG